jgi:hypothetical protein
VQLDGACTCKEYKYREHGILPFHDQPEKKKCQEQKKKIRKKKTQKPGEPPVCGMHGLRKTADQKKQCHQEVDQQHDDSGQRPEELDHEPG